MHTLLCNFLPTWLADIATALWYAALLALVFYFALEPKAEFNYLNV